MVDSVVLLLLKFGSASLPDTRAVLLIVVPSVLVDKVVTVIVACWSVLMIEGETVAYEVLILAVDTESLANKLLGLNPANPKITASVNQKRFVFRAKN